MAVCISSADTCPPGEINSPCGSQSGAAIPKSCFSHACTCRSTSSLIFTVLSFLEESCRTTCGGFELAVRLRGAWAAVGSFIATTQYSSKVSKTCRVIDLFRFRKEIERTFQGRPANGHNSAILRHHFPKRRLQHQFMVGPELSSLPLSMLFASGRLTPPTKPILPTDDSLTFTPYHSATFISSAIFFKSHRGSGYHVGTQEG